MFHLWQNIGVYSKKEAQVIVSTYYIFSSKSILLTDSKKPFSELSTPLSTKEKNPIQLKQTLFPRSVYMYEKQFSQSINKSHENVTLHIPLQIWYYVLRTWKISLTRRAEIEPIQNKWLEQRLLSVSKDSFREMYALKLQTYSRSSAFL